MPPAAAPNSFSVNRISVLFNWQNFNSCKFFSVFSMKTAAAKFWICISIDFYSKLFLLLDAGIENSIDGMHGDCAFFRSFVVRRRVCPVFCLFTGVCLGTFFTVHDGQKSHDCPKSQI